MSYNNCIRVILDFWKMGTSEIPPQNLLCLECGDFRKSSVNTNEDVTAKREDNENDLTEM